MTKAHETHSGKNATETAVRMIAWWPGISQDVFDMLVQVKIAKKTSVAWGKTVSTGPEAEVWEKFYMDWVYVKDEGKIPVKIDAGSGWMEAFPAGYRTSKTVKVYLCESFARFGIPKTFVSDSGLEFIGGDLKQ